MKPGPVVAVFALVCTVAGLLAVWAQEPVPAGDRTIAVLPMKNRAGDGPAAFAVEQALGAELRVRARVVDPGRSRRALRQLRIRDGDIVSPELLQELGRILGADYLVAATLHDAERRGVPRMSVSVRAYAGATGGLLWTGFTGGSGLDDRAILDLGYIGRVEGLAPGIVERLMGDLLGSGVAGGNAHSRALAAFPTPPGTLAVVPVDSVTRQRRTANAETTTEALRTALHRAGFVTVSPGCAGEVLRRRQGGLWGGVGSETRLALRESCGADYVVTGSVEAYDVGGRVDEPEPMVEVAVRVVETESGRILWMGSMDRGGWDNSGVFRLGRIYSRGALVELLTDKLARRMRRELFFEGKAR